MRRQLVRFVGIILAMTLATTLAASPGYARNDLIALPVAEAVDSGLGQTKLLEIPFYLAGQNHPAVERTVASKLSSNKSTNAFGKGDSEACNVAFLSAIITLQNRARREGADAVIDIKSVTSNQPFESASEYRCAVGNIVAKVHLIGTIVQFKK